MRLRYFGGIRTNPACLAYVFAVEKSPLNSKGKLAVGIGRHEWIRMYLLLEPAQLD